MTKQHRRFSVYVRVEIDADDENEATEKVNKGLGRTELLWYVEGVDPSEVGAYESHG